MLQAVKHFIFQLFSILQVIFGLSLLSSSNEELKNHGMDCFFKYSKSRKGVVFCSNERGTKKYQNL